MPLAEIDKGWAIRGTALASTVTEEMAAGFRTHLEKAKGYLDTAAKLTDEDPEIYRALIDVAKGLGSAGRRNGRELESKCLEDNTIRHNTLLGG